MKVTIVVCDRCGREMREETMEEAKLDLSLKFHAPGNSWLPFRRRESVELCPSCRDAFADWLGEPGKDIDGLRTGEDHEAEGVQKLRVQASSAGDGEGA